MMNRNFSILILAAGLGTRMKSDTIKVLHKIHDKPIITYIYQTITKTFPERIVFIVGHQADDVKSVIGDSHVEFVLQKEQLGTGHAVMCSKDLLKNYDGHLIIMPGDCPLIRSKTLTDLIDLHEKEQNNITVVTAKLPYYPEGYGRIVNSNKGKLQKIVEERDANEKERKIDIVNSGIYCTTPSFLFPALEKIKNNNDQKEYYLPDVIEIAVSEGKCGQLLISDYSEILGINTKNELATIENLMTDMKKELP